MTARREEEAEASLIFFKRAAKASLTASGEAAMNKVTQENGLELKLNEENLAIEGRQCG